MPAVGAADCDRRVALRKESVDRNTKPATTGKAQSVALRKESVDRNASAGFSTDKRTVALRKESVDRNLADLVGDVAPGRRSPQGERG